MRFRCVPSTMKYRMAVRSAVSHRTRQIMITSFGGLTCFPMMCMCDMFPAYFMLLGFFTSWGRRLARSHVCHSSCICFLLSCGCPWRTPFACCGRTIAWPDQPPFASLACGSEMWPSQPKHALQCAHVCVCVGTHVAKH